MCPKVELYNKVEVPVSVDYSSSEMKIANNQHRDSANACVKLLQWNLQDTIKLYCII
jgi:hypothetical protein